MRMIVKILHRQIDNLAEKLFSHTAHNALAQIGAAQALQQLAAAVKQIDRQHKQQRMSQRSFHSAGNHVDGFALQARRIDAAQRTEDNDGQHTDNQCLFPCKIGQNPLQGAAYILGILHLYKAVMSGCTWNTAFNCSHFTHGFHLHFQSENDKCPDRSGKIAAMPHGCRRLLYSRYAAQQCGLPAAPRRYVGQ